MAKPAAQPTTEAAARAALAAGRTVPLEWLWLLDGAALTVTNAGKPGKTLELAAAAGPVSELPQVGD